MAKYSFEFYSDAPTSGLISTKNGKIMHYRNHTVVFRAEFNESFPLWNSIIWKMNNEVLTNARVENFLTQQVCVV